MSDQFKVGDVVQLKSGGPKMTVTQVGNHELYGPTVWCVWFVGTKQEKGTFPPGSLQTA